MRLVLLSLTTFVFFCLPAFAQVSDTSTLSATQQTIVAPSDQYPTIQSAVYAAMGSSLSTTIEVPPGIYNENVVVYPAPGGIITIRARKFDTVTIHGGSAANTITVGINGAVRLENLNLTNLQPFAFYDTATVFGWGGVSIEVENCAIYSTSIGVSSSYADHTTISDSTFFGWSNNAVGVMASYQNPLNRTQGARIYNNTFNSFAIGTYHLSLLDESVNPSLALCKNNGRRCIDSNTYNDVAIPYYFTNIIPD